MKITKRKFKKATRSSMSWKYIIMIIFLYLFWTKVLELLKFLMKWIKDLISKMMNLDFNDSLGINLFGNKVPSLDSSIQALDLEPMTDEEFEGASTEADELEDLFALGLQDGWKVDAYQWDSLNEYGKRGLDCINVAFGIRSIGECTGDLSYYIKYFTK